MRIGFNSSHQYQMVKPASRPDDAAQNAGDASPPASPEPNAARAQQRGERDLATLEATAKKLNETVRLVNRSLEFEVVKDRHVVIRVKDTETGEIVREIPPEELIDAMEQIEKAVGLIIDEKV